ncbi:MAG: hypothetical protein KME60_06740 [Cyanomargarita calcarea GSE-NOS-MK-12-04C]|jgi:hypothetical protein|uniref:Uncharacterized protein n=1 Tax=Cyanomargarita calcarea GSE-NOS-MK-12-04C TaxID=2839659 RepID=A0A951UR53_9CYAN|nr:hypothetical protein [Cyanomargarita calcarea GSE-NOS-MK-12-04C]
MFDSNTILRLHLAGLSVIAVILATTPVQALPGQNVNSVIKWAKTKPQLPALKYNSEFNNGYDGTKNNLYFYVSVPSENGVVKKEGITVSGDTSIKFAVNNAKGVKLIQDIYGSRVSNDFRSAKFISKVGRDSFYQGKNYGYITAQVQNGTNIQIISLNNLQDEIKNAKFCQTNQCDV